MKTNSSNHVLMYIKKIKIYSWKSLVQFFAMGFIMVFLGLTTSCEGNERYFRPNLPEKLCCIGILDDDTINYRNYYVDLEDKRSNLRFLSFEKSIQSEYLSDLQDSMRMFSFKIFTLNKEVYSYHSVKTIKNLLYFEVPDTIKFVSGETYYLTAQENNSKEISAQSTVPNAPPDISLISIKKEIMSTIPLNCYHPFDTAYSGIFNISIKNTKEQNQFYAIIVYGKGIFYPFPNPIPYSGPTDFFIRESNTIGFYSELQELKIRHHACIDNEQGSEISPAKAYYFCGNQSPDDNFNLTISIPFHNSYSPIVWLESIRIKLLSLPQELYEYEKDVYTYYRNKDDPFSEPINLEGNVKNGNGVFAICKSSSLLLPLDFH
ncbi:MAG: DUF4249 family protein [Bacteroidota bacterium]